MFGVVFGITAMAWTVSADREHRYKMPEVRAMRWSRTADTVRHETLLTCCTAWTILPITILVETNPRAREGTEGSWQFIVSGEVKGRRVAYGVSRQAVRTAMSRIVHITMKQQWKTSKAHASTMGRRPNSSWRHHISPS